MKVSIMMTTYDHEQFIAKALDSVLMQKTDFAYQIVIGEDCSTDNTRGILLSYQKRFPEKIRLLLNERNLGGLENGRQTFDACTGEYIASLDGDDYWTSADKLQKQVDFLDNHPECSTCYHDVMIIHADGSKKPEHYRTNNKEFSTVEDLLVDNFIPTSAVMFRRGLFGKIPDWFDTLKIADWPIHILNAHHGTIGYIDCLMGVYVVHHGGIWSTKDRCSHATAILELFEALSIRLDYKYSGIMNRILRWRYFALSELHEYTDDLPKAGEYANKSLAKHCAILSESCFYRSKGGSKSQILLPAYMLKINSVSLLKILLRIYSAPRLKLYIPTIYQYLRVIAVRIL